MDNYLHELLKTQCKLTLKKCTQNYEKKREENVLRCFGLVTVATFDIDILSK